MNTATLTLVLVVAVGAFLGWQGANLLDLIQRWWAR